MVLVGHPKQGSLNHGIAGRAVSVLESLGHEVFYHDLYAEGFDPLLSMEELEDSYVPVGQMKEHCDELKRADGVVIVHPNWRHQPPAVLKGWVDRIIRAGVAFKFIGKRGEDGRFVPLLRTRLVTVFNTSDCPEEELAELGDPIGRFWDTVVFGNCGARKVIKKDFCRVFMSSQAQRESWLDEAEEILRDGFST